jgi:hypothetical protein
MAEVRVEAAELDRLTPTPILFDALIEEDEAGLVFVKTLTMADPGVTAQRVSPEWPHHLPGDVVISLTGQAGVIAMHRRGLIDGSWRGHGVRIEDARYSAPVLVGERFFTRVDIVRVRRWRRSLHVRFRFRMWKIGPQGGEVETFRSRQDAIFFPG